MTDYNYKIGMIKNDIIEFIKKKSDGIYNTDQSVRDFKCDDLITEMSDYYIWRFEQDFFDYISQNICFEFQLSSFGRNIGYALKTFIKLNPAYGLHTLDKFLTEFVNSQFDDLENWNGRLQSSYLSGYQSMIMQKKSL